MNYALGNPSASVQFQAWQLPLWAQPKAMRESAKAAGADHPQTDHAPEAPSQTQPLAVKKTTLFAPKPPAQPVVMTETLQHLAHKNQQLANDIADLKTFIAQKRTEISQSRKAFREMGLKQAKTHYLQHQALRMEAVENCKKDRILAREKRHELGDVWKRYRNEQKTQRRLIKEKIQLENRAKKEQQRAQDQLTRLLIRLGVLPKPSKKKPSANSLTNSAQGTQSPKNGTAEKAKTKKELEVEALDQRLKADRLAFETRYNGDAPKPDKPSFWHKLIYAPNGKIHDWWKLNVFNLTLPVAGLIRLISTKGSGTYKTAGFFGLLALIGSILGLFFSIIREIGFADQVTQGLTGKLDRFENQNARRQDYQHSTWHNEFGMPSGD